MDASKRLLPFGGTREQGSHKSYGLACMIDIMSNCLTGVGPGFVTGGGGSVFTAHNIEAFTDRETTTTGPISSSQGFVPRRPHRGMSVCSILVCWVQSSPDCGRRRASPTTQRF